VRDRQDRQRHSSQQELNATHLDSLVPKGFPLEHALHLLLRPASKRSAMAAWTGRAELTVRRFSSSVSEHTVITIMVSIMVSSFESIELSWKQT
jgi:hypothetical protein